MLAYSLGISTLRERPVGSRSIGDAVYPVTAVALGQQPTTERGLLLILIVIAHEGAFQFDARVIAPGKRSCNVLGGRLARFYPRGRTNDRWLPVQPVKAASAANAAAAGMIGLLRFRLLSPDGYGWMSSRV